MDTEQIKAIRKAYCSLLSIVYSIDGVYSCNAHIRELADNGSDALIKAFPEFFNQEYDE